MVKTMCCSPHVRGIAQAGWLGYYRMGMIEARRNLF